MSCLRQPARGRCARCDLPATHGKLCSAHRMAARRSQRRWLERQGRAPADRRYASTATVTWIWAARHVGGMKESDIARIAGMNQSSVSRILNKRRHAKTGLVLEEMLESGQLAVAWRGRKK